jgi:folate-binding protein YgfZ
VVRADPGGLDLALPHFRKYGVFDDVALDDVSPLTFELHLAGPRAEALVERCGGGLPLLASSSHVTTALAERPVRVVRESPTGRTGLTLIGDREYAEAVLGLLRHEGRALGLVELDAGTYEALRIEAGTPVFGRDVNADNLPQEMGRDARAINFAKGCYLGQETVARLDALGHVNKILKGLRGQSAMVPPAGTVLETGGKAVGTIGSSSFSPGWNAPVALAVIRVAQARPGAELSAVLPDGPVPMIVADLPMLPDSACDSASLV